MAEETTTAPAAESEAVQSVESTFLNTQNWIPDFIEPYWNQLQEHPWVLSFTVLAAGFIIAKIIQWSFKKIWGLVTSKTKNTHDDQLLAVLSKPVFSTIFYLFMALAVEAFQFETDTGLLFKRIIISLLVISLMVTALKGGKVILEALSQNQKRFAFVEERTIPIFNILSQIFIIGAASYFLILLWGTDPTAWLASAGVIGIAVGFAAKDTLSNLFAGFFIVADSPYKLGDYIVLDTGERGMVTHVGIRSTRLLTRDAVEVTIPNSVMGNAKIVNESGGPSEKTRIRIGVGVSYEADLEKVCDILETIADESSDIAKYPQPKIRAKLFNASSIDFQMQVWIDKPEIRGRITHNLILAIHKRFKEEGVEIPYAKQDLYIKESPERGL